VGRRVEQMEDQKVGQMEGRMENRAVQQAEEVEL
jgi:hypothetical protein